MQPVSNATLHMVSPSVLTVSTSPQSSWSSAERGESVCGVINEKEGEGRGGEGKGGEGRGREGRGGEGRGGEGRVEGKAKSIQTHTQGLYIPLIGLELNP